MQNGFKLTMAGIQVGGANFLHCWVADSVEHTE